MSVIQSQKLIKPIDPATAVRFNSSVDGDYLTLDDGRYIVCDPTYIGAPVGLAMPQYKEQEVQIEVFTLE